MNKDLAKVNKDTRFKKGAPGRPKGAISYGTKIMHIISSMLDDDQFRLDYEEMLKTEAMKPGSPVAKILLERFIKENIVDLLDSRMQREMRENVDFQRYRLHTRAHDIQQRILLSKAQKIYLMAGRRSGKTEGERLEVMDTIQQRPDARCLYIGLTITKAQDLMWQPIIDLLTEMGIKVKEKNRSDGHIVTEEGAWIQFGGNSTKDEREKNRGPWWDLIIIDECQSQKELRYLIETILEPTLIDRKGRLMLSGTGPRIRGTDWEQYWNKVGDNALRLNWNITENPFIPDCTKVLEEIRKDKGLTETDPLYVREYLGRISYDDDALVYRLGIGNYFTDDVLSTWIHGQPCTDIRFTAGLDFGFEDSDGFAIICYSENKDRPERWLVYEYKANRKSTEELAKEINKGFQYVRTSPLFKDIEEAHKKFDMYCDTGGGGKQIAYDLDVIYHLPAQPAYKSDKNMAVEILQDDARRGQLKCREDGPFAAECLLTVFKRDEQDRLTREVDDETYHPDEIDAVLYAMRSIWWWAKRIGE